MLAMWPTLPGLSIEAVDEIDDEYVVVARASTTTANCPNCLEPSSAVHSRYERNPHDLPSCGRTLRLCLQVRRFFCHNVACSRRIFCERLPQLIQKHARRTQRLVEALTMLAFALGGKAGERVVTKLNYCASRDTLLRFIRRHADTQRPAPRVLGVDDWAIRKGHTYGTLLCDLAQGTVIDLLPDREAETVAAWLKAHPTVEVVTRDRSKTYAAGITEGAPTAIQVADRWHLASNLVGAMEATLARYPSCLQGVTMQPRTTHASDQVPNVVQNRSTVQSDMLAARAAKRSLRQSQYEQTVALRQQGVSIAAIAAQLGISMRTVDRWLAHGAFPERKPRASQPTKLDQYHTYIHQRWQEGCHNLAQLYRELCSQGYSGSYSTVFQQYCGLRRMQDVDRPSLSTVLTPSRRRYSPRQAAFLFVRHPDQLSAAQQADLEMILAEHPHFQQWRDLAQQFMALLRERNLSAFDHWLNAVARSGSGSMKRFAAGLQSDYAAVVAALTHEWSNGPTEGHINKLKLVKRQMFGRAKLDLLRKRIMYRN
jgi:transposase